MFVFSAVICNGSLCLLWTKFGPFYLWDSLVPPWAWAGSDWAFARAMVTQYCRLLSLCHPLSIFLVGSTCSQTLCVPPTHYGAAVGSGCVVSCPLPRRRVTLRGPDPCWGWLHTAMLAVPLWMDSSWGCVSRGGSASEYKEGHAELAWSVTLCCGMVIERLWENSCSGCVGGSRSKEHGVGICC